MIDASLTYVRDILNEHFKKEFDVPDNKVVLSNIINPDGSVPNDLDGKIVFFLVNLEEEAALKNDINRNSTKDSGSFAQKSATLHLNMQLIFCVNFIGRSYTEGLSYLSSLIRFFQINKKLTLDRTKTGSSNGSLFFEVSKLDYSQISHFWSAIGTKLMPSIMYKVRFLTFDDVPATKIVPTISEPINESR